MASCRRRDKEGIFPKGQPEKSVTLWKKRYGRDKRDVSVENPMDMRKNRCRNEVSMSTVFEEIMKNRGGIRLSGAQANRLTRECIEKALAQLMEEKPFLDISITEIVARAGVSRSSFYRTYDSKEAVLASMRQQIFTEIKNLVQEKQYRRDIRKLLTAIFQYARQHQETMETLRRMGQHNNVIFLPQMTDFYEPRSQEELYAFKCCEGGMSALFSTWLQNGMQDDAAYMAELGYSMLGALFQKIGEVQHE